MSSGFPPSIEGINRGRCWRARCAGLSTPVVAVRDCPGTGTPLDYLRLALAAVGAGSPGGKTSAAVLRPRFRLALTCLVIQADHADQRPITSRPLPNRGAAQGPRGRVCRTTGPRR